MSIPHEASKKAKRYLLTAILIGVAAFVDLIGVAFLGWGNKADYVIVIYTFAAIFAAASSYHTGLYQGYMLGELHEQQYSTGDESLER